jgi:protein-S-isoprenylcysteine O-methyltransferase Ste14
LSASIPEYLLFACELYGIYAQGVSQAISPSICPPKSSNFSNLYQPNGQLPPLILIACLAAISGGIIRLACYKSLGHMFRWEVSIQDSHKLITSGPYSIVRHPSYSGVLLVVTGQVVRTLAKGTIFQECIVPSVGKWVQLPIWGMAAFRVGVTGWLAWRTQEEDKLLQKEFGKQWDAWATKTKYRMIPFVY